MSSLYSTTMWELLTNIKAIIDAGRVPSGSFESIKKVQRGALVNPTSFPFISVIPTVKLFDTGVENNGTIGNHKRIRIDVFSYNIKTRSGMRQVMGILDSLDGHFATNQSDWQIPDSSTGVLTAMYTKVIDKVYSDNPIPFKKGFIHQGFLLLDVYCEDPAYGSIDGARTSYSETDDRTVVDALVTILKAQKVQQMPTLKSIKDYVLTTQHALPLVFVTPRDYDRGQVYAGKDAIALSIDIITIGGSVKAEDNLQRVLALLETIEEIVNSNPELGGKTINTNLFRVTYGQYPGNAGLHYGGTIELNTVFLENVNPNE